MRKPKPVPLRRHAVAWNNPYTQPPNGLPRCLAEWIGPHGEEPTSLNQLLAQLGLGSGWGLHSGQANLEPVRRLSDEQKQAMRRRNLARRMQAKNPLFAAEAIAQKLHDQPLYYGVDND